jgi:predicted metalloprotease with PDZ domain
VTDAAPQTPVSYLLRIPEPHTHLLHVEMRVDGVAGPLELAMPSWTPGSYLMREFPRNVVALMAFDGAGRPLAAAKTDKSTWRVDAPADGTVVTRYVVHADELSVRTSHVDATHAAVNGASVFLFARGRQDGPHAVTVAAPEGWRTTTSLRETQPGTFAARDYDELVDSPMEIGRHALVEWPVDGVTHRWAVWGRGNWDGHRLAHDTTRIVLAEKALFGSLPYPDYTFILHVAPGGGGGLEHRNSTVLLSDRWSFRGPPYEHFLALTAHELFHAWNGKRIRPAVLGPFDLTREAYTRELWVVEGITSYYTDLLLLRAGLIGPQRYLERLAEQVTRLYGVPGRYVQPLEDSSFDTWIKFYRPDANSPNATVSYYLKGALVALLLDLEIRAATAGERSLDDVMRLLWERWGAPDVGFPEGEVERIAAEVAGRDLSAFFDRTLRGRGDLDYAPYLAAAGLELTGAHEPPRAGAAVGAGAASSGGASGGAPAAAAGETGAGGASGPAAAPKPPLEPRVGIQVKLEGGKTVVGNVLADSPAWRAGVNAGDELVALDGMRVGMESLVARLSERKHGDRVTLTVFRRDELVNLSLEVEMAPPQKWAIRPLPDATPEQLAFCASWLRVDVPPAAPAAAG